MVFLGPIKISLRFNHDLVGKHYERARTFSFGLITIFRSILLTRSVTCNVKPDEPVVVSEDNQLPIFVYLPLPNIMMRCK